MTKHVRDLLARLDSPQLILVQVLVVDGTLSLADAVFRCAFRSTQIGRDDRAGFGQSDRHALDGMSVTARQTRDRKLFLASTVRVCVKASLNIRVIRFLQ